MPWLYLLAALTCASPAHHTRLADDAHQGSLWSWGWGSALSVSAAGQLTLAALVDQRGFRIDRLVGGGTSVIGVLAVAISHPRANKRLAELSDCPSQAESDLTLARVQREERFMRAWYQHVLGAAFNSGAGLYLGLAHDRWLSGGLQAVFGTAVSSAMVLTRPHRVADLTLSPHASSADRSLGVTFSFRF